MGLSGLPGFWMSIIGDSSIQEQLAATMRVVDEEERALTLLTRTLFLIVMEIKCERDEALKTSEGMMEVVDGCDSCRAKVVREPADIITVGSDLQFSESQTPKEKDTHSGKLYEYSSRVSHKGNNKEEEEEEKEEEGETSITQVPDEVLVPATLDMESCFPETQRQRSITTERGFVLETLDMNDSITRNTSDMFHEEEEEEEEDDNDGDTQHTLRPHFKAFDLTQLNTQDTQQTLKASEHHTPTKWRSPLPPLAKNSASGRTRGRGRHSSKPKGDTRHSPYKTQDEAQNNSHSNISKHRNKQRSGYSKEVEEEEEYTEDVTVESENHFRTTRKENILSPHRQQDNRTLRTPNRSSQGENRSPEGSPVFKRSGKQRRITHSPSAEAKRDISQAFNVLQNRDEGSGNRGTPEKGKRSPKENRQQQENHVSLPSPADKGKRSPRVSRHDEGNCLSFPSPAEKGKGSPKGSRERGNHQAFPSPLPSPLPSPHNVSDELTSPSILKPFGVASFAKNLPLLHQRHGDRAGEAGGGREESERIKNGEGETGGMKAGGEEAEGKRGNRRGGGGRETTEIKEKGESEGIGKRGRGGGGGGGGVPLAKSASSLNAFTSARKLSLRRHQTEDTKRTVSPVPGTSGSRHHHFTLSPPDPQRKKPGYKQMTVYNYLNPKTAATSKPCGSGGRRVFVDDEEALRLAMEESLKLKALADMGRELDQREREGMETTSRAQQPIKESPIKLPNLRSDQSSLNPARSSPKTALRSPRLTRNSPRPTQLGSKLSLRSPDIKSSVKRKIIEEADKEEEEQGRGAKGKMEKGDKGREQDTNEEEREKEEGVRRGRGTSGVKRKLKEEEDEEEEMLPSAQVEGKSCVRIESKENASPGKGGAEERRDPPVKRSNREAEFQDSFDILPEREEPQFAHMGPVVRKKDARRQLEGWPCKQCGEFYKNAGSSTQEVKELINKCSRHRSKHKPLSNTPEGFWNPFFDD